LNEATLRAPILNNLGAAIFHLGAARIKYPHKVEQAIYAHIFFAFHPPAHVRPVFQERLLHLIAISWNVLMAEVVDDEGIVEKVAESLVVEEGGAVAESKSSDGGNSVEVDEAQDEPDATADTAHDSTLSPAEANSKITGKTKYEYSSGVLNFAMKQKQQEDERRQREREAREAKHGTAASKTSAAAVASYGQFDVAARLKREKLEQQAREKEAREAHKGTSGAAVVPGAFDVAARLKAEKIRAQEKEREAREMHKGVGSSYVPSGSFNVAARLKAEKLQQQQREREAKEAHKGGGTTYEPGAFDVASRLKKEKLEAQRKEQEAREAHKQYNITVSSSSAPPDSSAVDEK